ncbi:MULTISPECIES: ABC transporter ATP-binding protein [Pseudomonas]|uniref:Spermidine/putrescine import ATP-binding protein PotA n=2 Tax=Pseudomonas TaxID=286 RepID=A0A4R7UYM8_9PSED|nr:MULTISPECIES: ABC transporter ATP-binding protein [Pseudomonas]MDD1001626.1 ABC transporter ATP-binding protein [Pseudomonas sp. TNT2022 ID642]TDV41247.1 spermidine/putrescine transport system ATP-binding protein [Pseudomonas helmanticensis]VVP83662.1 Spermidine/putrescine import ATP-binding protein PotA [Pseudomonas fluorescens]
MGQPIAIEVRNVSKRYSEDPGLAPALDNVSVNIADNEFFTLLGPSGCGKTTLLRTIAGFEHVSEGEIRLAGEPVNDLPPFKRRVNTVFQSYALFPHMSVAQNIAFGLEMQGLERKLIPQRVNEMLALVQMEHLAGRKPAQLSGGQQQRVALARALAPKPKVLLLDEPLSALDLKLRKEMQVELKRVQKEAGITFIFVTHDQEEALTLSDRIAVMSAGKILQIGTPTDIYEHPKHHFVAQFIGDINFLPGQLKHGEHNEKLFVPNGMPVEIACQPQAFNGSSVQLAFRPERSQLVDASQPHHLRGVIEAVLYVGTATLYQCRLNNDIKVMLRENNEGLNQSRAVGERIAVHLPPHACLLMEA